MPDYMQVQGVDTTDRRAVGAGGRGEAAVRPGRPSAATGTTKAILAVSALVLSLIGSVGVATVVPAGSAQERGNPRRSVSAAMRWSTGTGTSRPSGARYAGDHYHQGLDAPVVRGRPRAPTVPATGS